MPEKNSRNLYISPKKVIFYYGSTPGLFLFIFLLFNYNYAEKIYGSQLNAIHHYETTEVKDSNGRLILPSGKVVDSTFTIPDPNDHEETLNPVVGIGNYEYEVIKNEKKRSIYLLKPQYLQQFLNDMRQEMIYSQSSQYLTDNLIRTENTRVTMP